MTTSPERSGAAPWYCNHESSRAATSTMVAAGLVTSAALMAFVGLLVTGDEVSALVAAMVMLVAGANTWSAGRSRTWWRADPVAGREPRPGPAPLAPTGTPPQHSARPVVADAPARSVARDRPVGPPIAERPPRPVETRSRPAAPAASPAPAPPPAPRPQLSVPAHAPAVPAAAPAVPAPAPAVVRLTAVSAAPPRGSRPARVAATGPSQDVAPTTTVAHRDGPDEHVTPSRAERTAPASASRPRRRTAPVRPVSRRVAGTRSS